MSRQQAFNQGVSRWILQPLCVVGIVVVLWNVGKRWRMLHGTTAPASVYQQLGKEGSGSSGVYTLVVRYRQPQHNQQFAHVATDRGTADKLALNTLVQVCYHPADPATALLSTEWSFSGKLIGLTLTCMVVILSIRTTRTRR